MPRHKKKYTIPAVPAVVTLSSHCHPEYMTLKRAAEYLGVPSVWTIRGLIEKQAIVAKRVGKYDLVRHADLDAY
jgi:excisionase family DNA binding protein